jgi:hypothetical protein
MRIVSALIVVIFINLENTPAHWASINNGIFLCMDCSGEHRGFGVDVSYVRSITLDSLNNTQINLLKVGGNKRLKNFLIFYSMPLHLNKYQVYSSKIVNYYRRMVINYNLDKG